MITQSFRKQLSEIVTFIFDNDKKFIKKFIINNLIKSGVSLDELIDIDLKNVFISDSLIFIRVQCFILNSSIKCEDFFLKSDDVFDWINSLKNKGLVMDGTTERSVEEMFTEEKIRFMYEKVYLQNNKQTKERNEHGDYVIPEIEAAWCGFKGAFNYLSKPGFGYYAFKRPSNFKHEWCICYTQDFEEDGCLSDAPFDTELINFVELENNELLYVGSGSDRDELVELGFIILDDPIWDFDPRFKSNLN